MTLVCEGVAGEPGRHVRGDEVPRQRRRRQNRPRGVHHLVCQARSRCRKLRATLLSDAQAQAARARPRLGSAQGPNQDQLEHTGSGSLCQSLSELYQRFH
eukprot:2259565-Rhodomonas_salina.2